MAALAAKTMEALNQGHKPVYPLFEKTQRSLQPPRENEFPFQQPASDKVDINNKNVKEHTAVDKLGQEPAEPSGQADLLEVDPNHGRRKRQKTASPKNKESAQDEEGRIGAASRQQEAGGVALGTGNKPQHVDCREPSLRSAHPPNSPISQKPEVPTPEIEGSSCISFTPKSSDDSSQLGTSHALCRPDPGADPIDMITDRGGSKPKRILRLNPKTGTIGSPPTKKKDTRADAAGKPSQTSRGKKPKSKIVTIHYGHDRNLPLEVGLKISQILQGTTMATLPHVKGSAADGNRNSLKVVGTNTAVAPHPFFLGKAAIKAPAAEEGSLPLPEVIETPRLEDPEPTKHARARPPKSVTPSRPSSTFPPFGGFGGHGRTNQVLKFPGAVEPAWPWKGMVHIRGVDGMTGDAPLLENNFSNLSRPKKSKYQAVEVMADENVVDSLATELRTACVMNCIKEVNIDEYPIPPPCLRLPAKHIESGPDLQRRVRKELSAPSLLPITTKDEDSSEDEIQAASTKRARAHPALSNIYKTITTSLSAFDQSKCETQLWTQKYSPKATAEVLQTGREPLILKEWLQTLTVMSVDTGLGERSRSRASSTSWRSMTSKNEAGVKRKQKSKKLEGFVVSSDESEDMDEISEPEEDESPHSGERPLKKTVVKAGNATAKGAARPTNAVVISGPHGCGKTAAVYAVAKELGFEVFEINSSSRRSGKDILEKVGDMTRNHLVQRSHNEAAAEPADEDARRVADALEDDLKSGRQGTMNSFFKPKEVGKPKAKPKETTTSTAKTEASKPAKAPPKHQKQSLILFEEVDILYEEDKQFWATVMAMIVQSKRPIIMTCSDEAAVPLSALSLHAIIRFTPPPIDLAADYMLLVAANEGHAIRRDAVLSLYESRHLDLRASLTELNFWCQFAVGDFRGGLDWIYPRWPPGSDVDKHGNILRVVSEGTYVAGMGWLSQDYLESELSYLDIEEETLHEAWDGWGMDVGDWQQSLDMDYWAAKTRDQPKEKAHGIAALSIYGDFLDTMSAADLCSGGSFAPDKEVSLDTNPPPLPPKAREDYILAREVLEVTPQVNFDTIGASTSLWMKSRARKYFQVDQHTKHDLEIPAELDRPSEARVIELIRSKCCSQGPALIRQDFSLAFDPISEPEKNSLYSTGSLELSTFDRALGIIATDIAPYVRSIVSYDARLQQDRARMSNLLSEGGRKTKRMRTTRSAMSALEGGARSTTRRERYFGPGLNPVLVLKTGLPSWLDAMLAETKSAGKEHDAETEPESGMDELLEGGR